MDCIRFWTVLFFCGFLFFLSLFFILKYQIQFYRYPVKDQGKSEVTVMIASIFYLLATFGFIYWGRKRDKRRQAELQKQYNNLPGNQFEGQGIQQADHQSEEKENQEITEKDMQ